jgi:hypothetical protein
MVANNMQIKPVQKRAPTLIFWARGIWRYQIRRIGRSMTIDVSVPAMGTEWRMHILMKSERTSTAKA